MLLSAGSGERAIGTVYSVNTLGSIVGVSLAALVLLPALGLKTLIIAGGAVDMGLGVWLLMLAGRKDGLGVAARVEASYHQYIEGPNTKLIWYDKGHQLGEIYVPDALAWIQQHLK